MCTFSCCEICVCCSICLVCKFVVEQPSVVADGGKLDEQNEMIRMLTGSRLYLGGFTH